MKAWMELAFEALFDSLLLLSADGINPKFLGCVLVLRHPNLPGPGVLRRSEQKLSAKKEIS